MGMYIALKSRNDITPYLEGVTEKNPLFVEAHLFDVDEDGKDCGDADAAPFAVCEGAVTGADGMFVYLDVIKAARPSRQMTICLEPKKYAHLMMPFGLLGIEILASTEERRGIYESMRSMRASGCYQVRARLYEGTGYGMGAAAVPGSEERWDLSMAKLADKTACRSVDAAEKWLLENHPDYWMGAIIEGQTEGMPKRIIPGPGKFNYPDGAHEDVARRRATAQEQAEYLNVSLGPKEYLRRWRELHGDIDG